MRVVDSNVLLYAADVDASHHAAARTWLDEALGGPETIGFSWNTILGFLRLSTHPALSDRPLSVEAAVHFIDEWLAQRSAAIIEPPPGHLDVVRGLLAPIGTGGNLVNDAHLAAIAIGYAAELVSFDSDFGRFPGVRWRRPGE